jgi:NTE family protein
MERSTSPLTADLVLEGGGVKGIALVGALSVLEERGYTFPRVAGTSAGAIVGALVAAGFGTDELRTIMENVDYRRFQDGDWLTRLGLPGKVVAVASRQGVYRGEHLRSWLGELLEQREVRTFADLAVTDPATSLPEDRRFRLVVMASDISDGQLRRLPWDNALLGLPVGGASVVDAVRASMSIPFFYRPWKVPARHGRRWFVDGGMLSNFPIAAFDRTDGRVPRWPTFGIKLGADPGPEDGFLHPIRGTLSFGKALLGTMSGFYDRIQTMDPMVRSRTIVVDTMGVPATRFDIDRATQRQLFAGGRQAAEDFLARWNWPAHLAARVASAATGAGEADPSGPVTPDRR